MPGRTEIAYDGEGRVTSSTVELGSLSARHDASMLFSERYERDDGGRVIAKTERVGGETHAYEYRYDAAGRLASVTRDGASVDAAGRPVTVVGSAAAGGRRNPGSDLPLGKGPGTRSDIDYLVSPSSAAQLTPHTSGLPSVDPSHGPIIGFHDPSQGPGILFAPSASPTTIGGR